jgi:hypothetical protein
MYAIPRTTKMKHESLFVKTPFSLFSSLPKPDKTALFFCARVMFVGDALAATKFGSAASMAASISNVRVGGGARLNFAM